MTQAREITPEIAIEAISKLLEYQFQMCSLALRRMKSIDFADRNMFIRVAMCNLPTFDLKSLSTHKLRELAVDMWVDRVEYVDNTKFYVYATKSEPLNEIEEGAQPRRLEGPQMRLTIHYGCLQEAPVILPEYMLELAARMLAIASPETYMEPGVSQYNNEEMMEDIRIMLMDELEKIMNDIAERKDPNSAINRKQPH